jgi:hypothetical protein
MIYGSYRRPCPALVREETRYICSLYRNDPDRYEIALDIGGGCCSPANQMRADTNSHE